MRGYKMAAHPSDVAGAQGFTPLWQPGLHRLIVGCLLVATAMLAAISVHAAPAGIALGTGDQVKINVYNHPDLNTEAQISANGTINFPLLGEVAIGGMDKAAAESKIAHLLSSRGLIPNAEVNLLVVQSRSQQVAVLGQVRKPGTYAVEGRDTLTDVLAQAGGITEKGGNHVVVLRKDKQGHLKRYQENLKRLLGTNGKPADPEIVANDVIYVPPAPVFYIYGEVQKPGVYRLADGMTVQQALSVAGGLSVRGTERGIRINRRGRDGKVHSIRVDLTDPVREDDVVYVKQSLF